MQPKQAVLNTPSDKLRSKLRVLRSAILTPLSRSRAVPKLIVLAILLLPAATFAQTPTPPPQLSPKAAYDDAVHPLELTRRSMSNWSATEISALAVSMANAKANCAARDPQTFTGPDLIDLARLCALGQNFTAVIEASTRYIAADAPKPLLTQAYAGLIDAQLHIKDETAAFNAAQAMLAAVPYDTLSAETLDEAIDFMQFLYTNDALTLARARQPHLLALLSETAPATPPTPSNPGAEPPQSLHDLYTDGIALPALQQLDKAPPASITATLAALNAALPATLTPDDTIPIDLARRRYALLGQPLPNLAHPTHPIDPHKPVTLSSLNIPRRLPDLPAPNAITALLLFPDWCAQCIRMAIKLPPTVFTVAGHKAYLYGLLAQTVPPNPPPPAPAALSPADAANYLADTPNALATIAPADAANYLRGSPTLIVDPSLLDQFAVNDLPFVIITDTEGIIRVLQPVSDDAINPGSTIDAAIAHIGALWPSPLLPTRFPFPDTEAPSPTASSPH